jgi:hypothetical protein
VALRNINIANIFDEWLSHSYDWAKYIYIYGVRLVS